MTDRPILFSAPMVRALLAGTKTQTRRVISTKPSRKVNLFDGTWSESYVLDPGNQTWRDQAYPWRVGDKLYVREAWRTESRAYDDLAPSVMDADYPVIYEADADWSLNKSVGRLRPGMHMPRWASRLTLTVSDIRVQRLQEINDEDAVAEGVDQNGAVAGQDVDIDGGWWPGGPRNQYSRLWNGLNEPRGFGWDVDPWVVAVSFAVDQRNIDEPR
ncbi:hypothetical protein [Mesorhizobium sp. M0701]|uniref:hypothetical protein n=1 Tax=Mesorhizobium sp. M0701 TaxID=2956989 RepID=UPI00333B65C3